MTVQGTTTHNFLSMTRLNRGGIGAGAQIRRDNMNAYYTNLALFNRSSNGNRVQNPNGQPPNIDYSKLNAQYAEYMNAGESGTKFDWKSGAISSFEEGLSGSLQGLSQGGDAKSALIGGVIGTVSGWLKGFKS